MIELAGVLVAPVGGVLLYRWLHHRPGTARAVDRFMYAVVPALVAWYGSAPPTECATHFPQEDRPS
jgi:hypothetical protein